ncbi:MAG: hypothetical protein OES24_22405, partial [Acidimicrobiia bacterium]|nr:hypothetical protein [Acidimicrobiia bacterium]
AHSHRKTPSISNGDSAVCPGPVAGSAVVGTAAAGVGNTVVVDSIVPVPGAMSDRSARSPSNAASGRESGVVSRVIATATAVAPATAMAAITNRVNGLTPAKRPVIGHPP